VQDTMNQIFNRFADAKVTEDVMDVAPVRIPARRKAA